MASSRLKRKPSEYVNDHVHFSVQYEHVAVELRHHVGVNHIMFATDFPHIECEYPNTMPSGGGDLFNRPQRRGVPHPGGERD